MKKSIVIFALAVATASFFSCGNETAKLKGMNDSIENVNSQQREILTELTSTLVEVSTSLDSIAAHEGLLKREAGEGGKALTKQQVIENLNAFKAMLAENRVKLNDMQKQLEKRDDQIGKLSALIKHLNKELDEKEATIKRLYDVISQKDATISDLNQEIESMNLSISNLEDESAAKQKLIDQQTGSINEVYYVMGTSSELKSSGLLKGGLLSKKKVDVSNVDRSLFNTADMRTLKTLLIPSKSAKVITNMPANAYTITKNDDKTCTLEITDPASFWNYTKYLIIETK
ncbi:MAG: hypothetical protein IJ533_08350 [Prevotella sp.]|nr:hypothetical protein [Prevotella sp.]